MPSEEEVHLHMGKDIVPCIVLGRMRKECLCLCLPYHNYKRAA